jgi:predicted nucleic acid-binding Zn ribbon protein
MPNLDHDTLTLGEYQQARGASEVSANELGVNLGVAARTCPVCHEPVPEDRKVTCSSECAQRYKGRENKQGRRQTKPVVSQAATSNGHTPPATPAPGLAGAVAALVHELGELGCVQRVTIETDAEVLTIARA